MEGILAKTKTKIFDRTLFRVTNTIINRVKIGSGQEIIQIFHAGH